MAGKRRRRRRQQASKQRKAPMKQAASTPNINDFPVEILQMIFKRVGSRAELYPLRLVCHHWNTNVMDVLEQWTTQKEMRWRPEDTTKQLALPAPKLVVIPTPSKLILEAVTANGTKLPGLPLSTTVYPSKSLTLVFQAGPHSSTEQTWSPEVTLQNLFASSKTDLKSLCISDAKTSMVELSKLFSQTGELKVLKIFQETTINGWSTISDDPPETPASPILPKLECLALWSVSKKTCNWLLETVAEHLVTLEMSSITHFGWDHKKYPNGLSNLQNLKLIDPFGVLSQIPIPNLSRLSISYYSNWHSEGNLFEFISRFATTLVELTIQSPLFLRDNAEMYSNLIFPKLSKLTLIGAMCGRQIDLERRLFAASFPKIEVLQLRTYCDISEKEARDYSNNYGHWGISSGLKEIRWATDQLSKKNVETYKIRRPE